jgi:hypothetical protein
MMYIRISSLTSFSIGQLIFLFSLYSSTGHIEKYNIIFIQVCMCRIEQKLNFLELSPEF